MSLFAKQNTTDYNYMENVHDNFIFLALIWFIAASQWQALESFDS